MLGIQTQKINPVPTLERHSLLRETLTFSVPYERVEKTKQNKTIFEESQEWRAVRAERKNYLILSEGIRNSRWGGDTRAGWLKSRDFSKRGKSISGWGNSRRATKIWGSFRQQPQGLTLRGLGDTEEMRRWPGPWSEEGEASSVWENKSIHSVPALGLTSLTRRHSYVGALLGDTQAGRGWGRSSLAGSRRHLQSISSHWSGGPSERRQFPVWPETSLWGETLTTQPHPTLIVGKIRLQALSMCSSSRQEKINPQQLLFYRKRFTDFNMPAKKKKYSQLDSFASSIGNGRDGWFPTEFFASELVLNLTALPLDSIQVSRRWQRCHSLSPSGQRRIFPFRQWDKMTFEGCLGLGRLVFKRDERSTQFASEYIKYWRLGYRLFEESA